MTDESSTQPPGRAVTHYYVDEAGDAVLFSGRGKVLVGTDGCSRHFILGKLAVEDPIALTRALDDLRKSILADPYFKGVPSLRPEQRKTAIAFHAKDDLPEVRREVFKVLLSQKVRFYAVVRNKLALLDYVRQQNDRDKTYRYNGNELYDTLVGKLFQSRLYKADEFNICFAERGPKPRTVALKKALENAVVEFERDFGIKYTANMNVSVTLAAKSGGLQAVDYFLWALQRFYEYEQTDKRESEARYLELVWPLISEVHDMDVLSGGKIGVFYTKEKPLTLEVRDVERGAKKKPKI